MIADATALFEQDASSARYADIENGDDACGRTAGAAGLTLRNPPAVTPARPAK